MKTYIEKLQELGVEALQEYQEEIKKAIKDSQIEVINRASQYIEKLLDVLDNSEDE